ncbi:NnrS family protein [Pararhodobacter oceanensis]|uniref:NnrS family protein n=1 Tax=Pararhodobacter oceanensis TaxID=2172121 RepID=UPI003A935501
MTQTQSQSPATKPPLSLTAFFSLGFRPFFLLAALWAALAMLLWIGALTGVVELPTSFDPVSWHAHEFLFGYLGAVIAGFLLTAVPNWTGRPPLQGAPLAALVGAWLIGRIAVTTSLFWPAVLVAILDLIFPCALAVLVLREIIAGRNWRNLIVVGMLALLILGNLAFHIEAAEGAFAAQGYGLRLGLAAGVMMIAVIGGRIIPAFTRNWLMKRGAARLPTPPMARFDVVALLVLLLALLAWVARPDQSLTAAALILAGLLHIWRLMHWAGERTLSEPLMWVLHLAYVFVPAGALAIGIAGLTGAYSATIAAQHLWMAGALGLMTLAVMTRASLGHTGRPLVAGLGSTLSYLLILASVALRVAVWFAPDAASALHALSALFWIAGFGLFALHFAPLMLRPRPAG